MSLRKCSLLALPRPAANASRGASCAALPLLGLCLKEKSDVTFTNY
ncbi:MAG: hypothetical protein J6M62_04605 [Selenomonadaceae bacterium]|nr:hypothetical protein [Selenomonadaceae bacterium]